jgi:hypothetical protein
MRWPKITSKRFINQILPFVLVIITVAVAGLLVTLSDAKVKNKTSITSNQIIAEIKAGTVTSQDQKVTLTAKYLDSCKEVPCVWKAARELTSKYGPQVALDTLDYYKLQYPDAAVGDIHEWGHIVGRQTAATFGTDGQAFLKCPTTFNYGCQHGFFEEVLGTVNSPKEAIDQICGQLEKDSSYSPKFKFYCYHGVGHGVMQSLEYDLYGSLAICDGLDSPMAKDGCWQGVFMENINGDAKGEAKPGIFLSTDPLAPCDKVAQQYQHECYINHSAHLMRVFGNNVAAASSACLAAAADQINGCLESIGLMVTNDSWQDSLLPKPIGTQEQKGWQLCQYFPAGHVNECVEGGLEHFLQIDQTDITRASNFCNLIDQSYRSNCYHRMGQAIRVQTNNDKSAENICMTPSLSNQKACLEGVSGDNK